MRKHLLTFGTSHVLAIMEVHEDITQIVLDIDPDMFNELPNHMDEIKEMYPWKRELSPYDFLERYIFTVPYNWNSKAPDLRKILKDWSRLDGAQWHEVTY